MSPWPTIALIASIKAHEGLRLEPYQDSNGYLTVGYGTRLPLSEPEAELLLTLRYGLPNNPYQHAEAVMRRPTLTCETEAEALMVSRLNVKERHLAHVLKTDHGIVWSGLPVRARETLLEMAYQMGVAGLMAFNLMLLAVHAAEQSEEHDKTLKHWRKAYDEALDSAWARETPVRARRVADGFLTLSWRYQEI